MKSRRWFPLFAIVPVLGLLAACGGTKSDGGDDEYGPKAVAAAAKEAGTANGLCPVMKNPVQPGVFTTYKGQKIGFCCPPCKPKFEKEPEKYIAEMAAHPDRYGYTAAATTKSTETPPLPDTRGK